MLARSGELLAAGLRTEQVLDAVVDLLVPGIADWCAVHLVGDGNAIQLVRARHRDAEFDPALGRLLDVTPVRRDQEYGAGPAIGQGRTVRMRGIDDAVLERIAARRRVRARAAARPGRPAPRSRCRSAPAAAPSAP